MTIRPMTQADFIYLRGAMDAWWGGRPVHSLLHPSHLHEFGDMAFVLEEDGTVLGFVVGFVSQTRHDQAYVHLLGVAPSVRRRGAGRMLYDHFFSVACRAGCRRVKGITSPTNQVSIAFHERMGFRCALQKDYGGPGEDRVVMTRDLPAPDRPAVAARFHEMTWERKAPGAREKVIEAGARRLRLLELTPDFVERDWCRRDHLGWVVEGEVEVVLSVGDGSATTALVLQAGDGLALAGSGSTPHRARSLTPRAVLFLVE